MHTVHLVFHVSKLVKYCMDGWCQPPPPPIKLEGELEYEIEKILNRRTCKIGRRSYIEYLLHWRGHDHVHDSWEPVQNSQNCQKSIQAYEDSRGLMPSIGRRGTKGRSWNYHMPCFCVTDPPSLGSAGLGRAERQQRSWAWTPWPWSIQRWLAQRSWRTRQ